MSKFTEHLWDELAREHGPRLALSDPPARSRRTPTRPRHILAGSTLALAGTGAGLLLALGGGAAASPAFAVTRAHDGAVSVHVYRASGVAGANRQLARMGVRERVHAAADGHGMTCLAPGAGSTGEQTIVTSRDPWAAAGNTGPGGTASPPSAGAGPGSPWHVIPCGTRTGPGSTGNSGSGR